MKEIVKKSFLLGLGAAALTKKQAEKIIKDLMRRNKVTIKEGRELLKKISSAANEERRRINTFASQEAERIAKTLGSIPKAKIEKAKKRLRLIDKELTNRGKKALKSILNQL